MQKEYADITGRLFWKVDKLAKQNETLRSKLEQQQTELESLRLQLRTVNADNDQLIRELRSLRTAQALQSNDSAEVAQAKEHINRMIRKVDRCLELISM